MEGSMNEKTKLDPACAEGDPAQDASRERRREQKRAWCAANREKCNRQNRAWYAANREKYNRQRRAAYAVLDEATLEKLKAKKRAWDAANREKTIERKRKRYAARRDELLAQRAAKAAEAERREKKRLLRAAKRRAKYLADMSDPEKHAKRLAEKRKYYWKHRDRLSAKRKTPEAREKINAARRAYEARNREKVRAAKRAWNEANPDKVARMRAKQRDNNLRYKRENASVIRVKSAMYKRRTALTVGLRSRLKNRLEPNWEFICKEGPDRVTRYVKAIHGMTVPLFADWFYRNRDRFGLGGLSFSCRYCGGPGPGSDGFCREECRRKHEAFGGPALLRKCWVCGRYFDTRGNDAYACPGTCSDRQTDPMNLAKLMQMDGHVRSLVTATWSEEDVAEMRYFYSRTFGVRRRGGFFTGPREKEEDTFVPDAEDGVALGEELDAVVSRMDDEVMAEVYDEENVSW